MCMQTYTCNNNEKGGHKFEEQQGGIYGRVWTEEREEEIMELYYDFKNERNNILNTHTHTCFLIRGNGTWSPLSHQTPTAAVSPHTILTDFG